jgi:hypothetical protein
MHNVLHVPDLHSILFSVKKLILRSLKVHFNSLGCIVWAIDGEMLVVISIEPNLYQLERNVVNEVEMSYSAHSGEDSHSLELWHKRLGNLNYNNVKMLQSMVSGTWERHKMTCIPLHANDA